MSKIIFDFWACQRPLTKHWGSGQVYDRICKNIGKIDVVFGKTDNIPDGVIVVDKNINYDWLNMPYEENQFEFGYWDPPYDHLYKKEGQAIWKVCKRLAILYTHIFPIVWLIGAKREAMIAITMGPLKQIRCLQIFKKGIVNEKEVQD